MRISWLARITFCLCLMQERWLPAHVPRHPYTVRYSVHTGLQRASNFSAKQGGGNLEPVWARDARLKDVQDDFSVHRDLRTPATAPSSSMASHTTATLCLIAMNLTSVRVYYSERKPSWCLCAISLFGLPFSKKASERIRFSGSGFREAKFAKLL